LPDKSSQKQEHQESKVVAHYMRSSISPLPPPEFIDTYEKHHKGTMKILLDIYSEEQANRHEIEKNESDANIESMRMEHKLDNKELNLGFAGNLAGQIFSLIICLCAFVLCAYLAVKGYAWVAVSVVAIPFAGIIRAIMKK
jgi:uncharacterized membrane protein